MLSNQTTFCKSQFHTHLATCRSKLYALARTSIPKTVQGQTGVSDVVQETCLRAYRHLASFRGTTHRQFGKWLQSILRNQLTNLSKRAKLSVEGQVVRASVPVHFERQPAFHEETPSRLMMAQEEQLIMYHALQQLSVEERHVLARHHRDQRTFAELGIELKCSEEAARKRWARALLRWQRLVQGSHA
ncbi:MAG: sigma-70 family RNA polymerase sigma factor [Gemmatales bacterium]